MPNGLARDSVTWQGRDGAGKKARTDLVLVASHDCDVSSPDFEKEPWVEVIRAKRAKSNDGNLTNGKNPRRLQLSTSTDTFVLDIDERWRIPRTVLARHDPAGSISPENGEVLRNWLARRYDRAAFPDAFNERISEVANTIRAAVSTTPRMSGLYVRLSTQDELDRDIPYEVALFATMTIQDFDDLTERDLVLRAVGRIESAMSGCEGINVLEADAISEDSITLHDLHVYRRWEYDYVSLRPGKRGSIAPRP